MATLTELHPASVALNGPDVVLSCIGTGFTEESVITFAGNAEPTTFVSDTEVTTGINASLPWGEVVVDVTVDDSASLQFEFTAAIEERDPNWLLDELKAGNLEALSAATDAEMSEIEQKWEEWAYDRVDVAKDYLKQVNDAIDAEKARREID